MCVQISNIGTVPLESGRLRPIYGIGYKETVHNVVECLSYESVNAHNNVVQFNTCSHKRVRESGSIQTALCYHRILSTLLSKLLSST